MSIITFKALLTSNYLPGNVERVRPRFFLSGLNEMSNGFASFFPNTLDRVNGAKAPIVNQTIGLNNSAISDPYVTPITYTYTTTSTIGNRISNLSVFNSTTGNRSAFQLMQDIAAKKPHLSKIRIIFYEIIKSASLDNLGKVYFGKNTDPFGGKSGYNELAMGEFFNPNYAFGANGLVDINGIDHKDLIIDIPIDLNLDEYTMLGFDGPVFNSNITQMEVALTIK